jgi:hypothetical protein
MIEIEPATLATASWVTANLRAEDRAEVFCQLPDNTPTAAIAEFSIRSGEAFVALDRGNPVALFGSTPMTAACFSVWALGTKRFARAVPEMTVAFMSYIVPRRIDQGFRCAEARAMQANTKAVLWLDALGGEVLGEPFPYGKDDELFLLFRWTVAGYRSMNRKTEGAHVLHSRR